MKILINSFLNFYLLFPFLIFSQTNPETDFSETRLDKYLKGSALLNLVTATDHLPLFVDNPLDHWTSSKLNLLIDGIDFDQFPFNFNSPNLLPVNLPYISESQQTFLPKLKNFISSPMGFINIKHYPDVPDSFTIKLKSYLGSETGDPLIHTFTKENLKQGNKNKIPLSGSLSLSNKISKFSYQLSLGVYGHFSTGSGNDEIILKRSNYFSQKQNKQLLGSVGFKLIGTKKKEYSISATGLSYYGWDIPPFITSFIHFETYLYTIRASANNIVRGLSLSFVNDGSITEVHKGNGIPKSKFNLSKYTLLSKFEDNIGGLQYDFSSHVSLNKAFSQNLSDTLSVKFFKEDLSKLKYGINLTSFFSLVKNLITKINFRLAGYSKEKILPAGSLIFQYQLNNNQRITLSGSSITAFPNLTVLYGNFFLKDINTQDTFMISGNRNLLYERINHLDFIYLINLNDLDLIVELFAEKIEHPIRQETMRSIIGESGELFRDAVYKNLTGKKIIGSQITIKYHLKDLYSFLSYRFVENSETSYYPRISILSKLSYKLPIGSDIKLILNYTGKTTWEEFSVTIENENQKNSGNTGELEENISFDFGYSQKWIDFYFFKKLILGLSIQNIFNNRIKFLPIGNKLERTVIFSFSSEI